MRIFVQSLKLAAVGALVAFTPVIAQDEGGETQEERTTTHGVFNEEQAKRGEDLFWNICAECHFEDDFGGAFINSWSGASVKDLLEEIKATMPEDNPGGMPDLQYLDVITFMFKLNGLPTGDAEMTVEESDAIDIAMEPSGN